MEGKQTLTQLKLRCRTNKTVFDCNTVVFEYTTVLLLLLLLMITNK